MASTYSLARRRSAAQRHVVEEITREIRAADPHLRRKYLREFSSAYQSYESLLTRDELDDFCGQADILLVGDYHSLPSSQRFAAETLQHLASAGRPVVLAVEFVFTRDQHILDEWVSGEIDNRALRDRIRFDLDWGFEWEPFYDLLETGRQHAEAVYALDCTPRNNLRRIAIRDRHAAARIADIRERHRDATVVVLIGECHLAPSHLPALVRALRPLDNTLILLQNVDALYWRSAGEPCEHVDAVRVSEDVACAFNATPLEKYESYRIAIEKWQQEGSSQPDLAPAIYHMISALLRFLSIDEYSPSTGSHAGFLVDRLPEVRTRISDAQIRAILLRKGADEREVRAVLSDFDANSAKYLSRANTMLVREFDLASVAGETARFLRHACGGAIAEPGDLPAQDRFYRKVFEECLVYFGSRTLCPRGTPVREMDLYALYSDQPSVTHPSFCSPLDYMRMIDFLVLHKDYEANCRYYHELPELLAEGVEWTGDHLDFVTRWLGRLLGSQLYDAYVSGRITRRFVRSLFLRDLRKPGSARIAYFVTARRTRNKYRGI
jgi:hypothetical protein